MGGVQKKKKKKLQWKLHIISPIKSSKFQINSI